MKIMLSSLSLLFITYTVVADSRVENNFSQCGINSLYTCLSYLNVKDNLNSIYSNIQTDGGNKVNLYQIAVYAEKKGLYFKPILKPTIEIIDALLNKNSAAILQYEITENGVKNSHIITLIKPFGKEIKILDFPRAFIVEKDNIVESLKSSGGMLILSKKPFSMEIDITNVLWFLIILCVLFGVLKVVCKKSNLSLMCYDKTKKTINVKN